jgi:phage baseplate assembly protein W
MLVPKFRGLNSIDVFNTYGGTNVSEGNVKFQQDVKNMLETPYGSVLGNTEFGSNMFQLLQLPVNASLGTMIQEEIKSRIEKNYKDIVVDTVDVVFDKRTVTVKIGMNNSNSNVLEYVDMNFDKESD